ncbi:hypothetical protein UPYG_G00126130 [Umbra pygmaea]|uniref:Interleukin-12 subunit beta n=1 Tax=Umbra pygmaea TaxID=75934 RepID=A0ABD0X630_UMBPY
MDSKRYERKLSHSSFLQMIMHSLKILVLILHVASSSQHVIIEPLMSNVLVVKVDVSVFTETHVSLSCGESYEDRKVVWKNNRGTVGEGNMITVKVEEMRGGNYSCYNTAGDYLNHTLVLVQDISKQRILTQSHRSEYINCFARNYSGIFHCSWTKHKQRKSASVVLIQAGRRSGGNISCTVDSDGSGLSCEDLNSCSFGEEVSRINLKVYFRTSTLLEEYTVSPFYIRERVRPDAIDIIKMENKTFSWSYPATWSIPCSYFPLLFQVKAVKPEVSCDSEEEVLMEAQIIKEQKIDVSLSEDRYHFCVRNKDALVDSVWSPWIYHEQENKMKNNNI